MRTKMLPVAGALLLMGCTAAPMLEGSEHQQDITQSSTVVGYVLIEDYNDYVAEEFEDVRNRSYDNLNMEQCVLDFPDCADAISLLTIYEPQTALSDDFSLTLFRANVEEQIQIYFPDTKYDENQLYVDARQNEMFLQSDSDYPRVNDCWDMLQNNSVDYSWFMYETDQQYAIWNLADRPLPYRMSKGVARNLSGSDHALAAWLPSHSCELEIAYNRHEIIADIAYPLSDGTVSMSDALEFVEQEYLNTLQFESDFSLYVHRVGVFEINKGLYGYNCYFSKAFEGIPFDYEIGGMGHSSSSDGRTYSRQMAELFLISADDVDTFLDLGVHKPYQITDELNEIISLTSAARIVSDTLTRAFQFDVESIQLLYSSYYPDAENVSVCECYPEWKFWMRNPNDESYYAVYVNAQTGESRYQRFYKN